MNGWLPIRFRLLIFNLKLPRLFPLDLLLGVLPAPAQLSCQGELVSAKVQVAALACQCCLLFFSMKEELMI